MPNLFRPIPVNNPDKIIDISNETVFVDLKTHMPSDEGHTIFLLAINGNTRQIDVMPMKNKTAEETAAAFREMWMRRNIRNIRSTKRIICDKGSEFKGEFQAFCSAHRVEILPYNDYHKNSTSLAERAISTVSGAILKHLNKLSLETRRRENKWMYMLPIIIQEINSKVNPRHTLADVIKPVNVYKQLHPIGTEVYRQLKKPVQLLNGRPKYAFRNGDRRFDDSKKRVITDYRIRNGDRPITYILDDDYSIAYMHHEVIPI